MSYTPESQLLRPHIDKVIAAIHDFQAAAQERLDNSSEWKQTHLRELSEFRKRMLELELDLSILRNETV